MTRKKSDEPDDAEEIRRLMDEGKTREADELLEQRELEAELEDRTTRPGPGEEGWKPEAGDVIPAAGLTDLTQPPPPPPAPTPAELAAKVDAVETLACDYCGADLDTEADADFAEADLVALEAKNKIRCTTCEAGNGPRYTSTRKPSKKRVRV